LESVVCEDSRAELALERLQRVLPLTEKRIPKLLKRAKLMNLDVMDGIDRFGSKSDQPRQKCTKELKKSIDMVGLGVGPLVKKLWIPSWDDHLDILEFVFPYLINLKMIKFNHPSHDPDFIPTLRPSIINESQRLLERVKSVGVDDVDSEGWPVLIDSLTDHGQHLKILNLECCTEKDPFISGFGLSKMFSKMKDLECVRFDAAPIGSGEFGGDNDLVRLARTCLNLRAISIDYCDITINSFFTLWNECEHLDFLGFAGLQQATVMVYPELVMKPKLKTLRFVDVQANDQIVTLFY
jgi:hypothetical protein